jgi:hypothetical protein
MLSLNRSDPDAFPQRRCRSVCTWALLFTAYCGMATAAVMWYADVRPWLLLLPSRANLEVSLDRFVEGWEGLRLVAERRGALRANVPALPALVSLKLGGAGALRVAFHAASEAEGVSARYSVPQGAKSPHVISAGSLLGFINVGSSANGARPAGSEVWGYEWLDLAREPAAEIVLAAICEAVSTADFNPGPADVRALINATAASSEGLDVASRRLQLLAQRHDARGGGADVHLVPARQQRARVMLIQLLSERLSLLEGAAGSAQREGPIWTSSYVCDRETIRAALDGVKALPEWSLMTSTKLWGALLLSVTAYAGLIKVAITLLGYTAASALCLWPTLRLASRHMLRPAPWSAIWRICLLTSAVLTTWTTVVCPLLPEPEATFTVNRVLSSPAALGKALRVDGWEMKHLLALHCLLTAAAIAHLYDVPDAELQVPPPPPTPVEERRGTAADRPPSTRVRRRVRSRDAGLSPSGAAAPAPMAVTTPDSARAALLLHEARVIGDMVARLTAQLHAQQNAVLRMLAAAPGS